MRRRDCYGFMLLAAAACTTSPRPAVKKPEPSSTAELAMATEFRDLYARIWGDLRDEVRDFE